MKKKFKITLVVFLVVALGCFSQVFAATNQNNKADKISQVRKNARFLQSASTDDGVVGTSNLNGTAGNSAKVGNVLKSPEVGWKRYDDSNSKIAFSGTGWVSKSNGKRTNILYMNTGHWAQSEASNKINFRFYGNKLRIIGTMFSNRCSKTYIVIDGVTYNYVQRNTNTDDSRNTYQMLVFEKLDLSLTYHTVEIYSDLNNGYIDLDAIDINDNGILLDQSSIGAIGISLNKTTDSLTVGQTETLTATVIPNEVTNKNVTWTSSDPSIATVDSTGKVTAIGAGTATIMATTTDGSNLSTSCTVTVTGSVNPTPNPTDKAVLNITMTNGQIKQYNVDMYTVNKFISWYKLKSEGSGEPFYEFNITETSQSSVIKTDYVVFDKISSFEVDETTGNINQNSNSDTDTLKVVMTNGESKQYNINMSIISKFISWYDLKQEGSGDPFYEFNITQDSSTNTIKTDYIIADKISSFEVDDYTK